VTDPTREAIRAIAAQVVSGQLPPVEGAEQIAAQAARLDDPGELAVFADLARTRAETEILEEVSLLLADTA
jgi:anthranilate phosphoribosyltransferase